MKNGDFFGAKPRGADLESGTSPIGAKFPVPLVVVVWTDVLYQARVFFMSSYMRSYLVYRARVYTQP